MVSAEHGREFIGSGARAWRGVLKERKNDNREPLQVKNVVSLEYYVAMRKNEIWPFVATWMELESVMLSEISHTEKDRYHMVSLLCGP